MHKEILTNEQIELLSIFAKFKKDFGLVGGTAIALHIGHRESIDFDMFSAEDFRNINIRRRIERDRKINKVLVNRTDEFTFFLNQVKVTFFHYPFEIPFAENFEDVFRLPDLLTLAAMKAYALGQRNKWKDCIDLYFILEKFYSADEIMQRADELFAPEFNAKIFKTQLAYFDDINYREEVVFKEGFEVDNEEVKRKLIEHSLS